MEAEKTLAAASAPSAQGRFGDHLRGRLVNLYDHHAVAWFQLLIGWLQILQSAWPVSLNGLV